jgi:hypothetical protein
MLAAIPFGAIDITAGQQDWRPRTELTSAIIISAT